ncbi:hypothetical protein ACFP56_20545 [Paenibacillus septentrionalis]|uniref:ABC transporter permease n=1 Tax=Paenibacillus septentrionalis TaxID=429342 RepID=A0ABW1VB81_9BACL
MLKLLKYNWKMNSLSAYIVFASAALLYGLLLVGNYQWDWMDELAFAFGAAIAMLSGFIFIIMTSISFNHQIKSYHRRLLPIKPIEEIVATLLLGIIYMLLVGIMALVYFLLLDAQFSYDEINKAMELIFQPGPIFNMTIFIIWDTLMLLTLIMLAIAATYCFRGKYRAWIGVLVFIGFSIVMDVITTFLVGATQYQHYGFLNFDFTNEGLAISDGLQFNWRRLWSLSMLVDGLEFTLKIVLINYLMKKRIQV